MIRVMFVCYGNICRSPMAEFLFKYKIKQLNIEDEFSVSSSATSYEEIGSRVHRGTREVLDRLNIDYSQKRAVRLKRKDYDNYDYILVMDEGNLRDAVNIMGGDPLGKIKMLLQYTDNPRGVADPWYTHNFEATFDDITKGIDGFLNYLRKKGDIK